MEEVGGEEGRGWALVVHIKMHRHKNADWTKIRNRRASRASSLYQRFPFIECTFKVSCETSGSEGLPSPDKNFALLLRMGRDRLRRFLSARPIYLTQDMSLEQNWQLDTL